jgi:phage host-nuclease inhibitor protein Gam
VTDERPTGNGIALLRWRVDNLERDAQDIRRSKADARLVGDLEKAIQELKNQKVDVLNERMTRFGAELQDLKTDVEALRATLVKTAVSVAGSSIIFALTIFAVLH